jgi:hypothetical protein
MAMLQSFIGLGRNKVRTTGKGDSHFTGEAKR